MAKLAAFAAGPVGFTDSIGRQLFLPVSAIYFENGIVKFTAPGGLDSGTQTALGDWLSVLANWWPRTSCSLKFGRARS